MIVFGSSRGGCGLLGCLPLLLVGLLVTLLVLVFSGGHLLVFGV